MNYSGLGCEWTVTHSRESLRLWVEIALHQFSENPQSLDRTFIDVYSTKFYPNGMKTVENTGKI
jgi:hypothetical protein